MRKGSITLFLSLVLVFILLALLALLESVRVYGIKQQIVESGTAAMDSVFSEYDADLFSKYGLMFYNETRGNGLIYDGKIEQEFENYYKRNLNIESQYGSFFRYSDVDSYISSEIVATDYDGEIFFRSVVDFYKYDLATSAIERIENKINDITSAEESYNHGEDNLFILENQTFTETKSVSEGIKGHSLLYCSNFVAKKAVDSALQSEVILLSDEEDELSDQEKYEESLADTPIDEYINLQSGGFYNLVLPSGKSISGTEIPLENLPSKTSRDNRVLENDSIIYDLTTKVMASEYCMDYFNSFVSEETKKGVQYEIEYLLFGKSSDAANLKAMIQRLLIIRTGMNMLTIQQSASKMTAIESAAVTALGWTGIPPLVTALKGTLMLVWAYAESIIDVRGLLSGEKIPFFKDDSSWNLGLEAVTNVLNGSAVNAKTSDDGMSYEDYLRCFLYIMDSSDLAYRSMDMIQLNMQQEYPNFQMQSEVYALEMTVETYWKPLFVGKSVLEKKYFKRTDVFSELY